VVVGSVFYVHFMVSEMIAEWPSASRAHVLHDVPVECRASDDRRQQSEKSQTQRRF